MTKTYPNCKCIILISVVLILTLTVIWWSSGREIGKKNYIKMDYDVQKNRDEMHYDLRIIVIVYNRVHSLIRLLNSLNEAEYDFSDLIKLEVWIDRSEEGNVSVPTLHAAQNFTFKHGEYEILPHPQHVGIYGQWLTTWKPHTNSSEIAIILEDDVTVSKYFWRYLKMVHQRYDKIPDVNGYSLQGYINMFSKRRPYKTVDGVNSSFVFLYPVLGTWGFSPSTENWNKFLLWLRTAKDKPYVPDNRATDWYKTLSKQGRANTMWEMWHIYYAWKNKEFTLYCNFPGHAGLTTGWREKGLHYSKAEGSSNALITEWKAEYGKLPDNIPYFDIAGDVIHR